MAVLDKSLWTILDALVWWNQPPEQQYQMPGGGEKWLVSSTLQTWFSKVDGK